MKGLAIAAASLLLVAGAWAEEGPVKELHRATRDFSQIMSSPGSGIPQGLLNKAQCVVIIPGLMKAGFIVGGEYGHGFAVCRNPNGAGWAAPAAMKLEGGSVGFQIGGAQSDIVLLVMTRDGMWKLLGDKITLGTDASVAAGPVGRGMRASTNLNLHAEILGYSRSRGAFAGIALTGATLHPDTKQNDRLYGRAYTTREIVMDHVAAPVSARPLIAELDRYSTYPTNTSSAERAK